jgi:hypothetical protein
MSDVALGLVPTTRFFPIVGPTGRIAALTGRSLRRSIFFCLVVYTAVLAERSEALKNQDPMDLTIRKLETNKDAIPQRVLMRKDVIPRHPSSVLFNGSSGSGKSTLLLNLLTRKEFLGGYFHKTYLFSPTGDTDDLFKTLKIAKKDVFTELKEEDLQDILDKQERMIKKKGVDRAKRVLIIFEDVQGDKIFMKSKAFLRAFIANRHFGVSSWLCGQSFTKTPRACRLQANNIFYFKGGGSELKMICDEFCPGGMTPKEFRAMVNQVTKKKYSFLHINMRVHQDERYRENLGEILYLGEKEYD